MSAYNAVNGVPCPANRTLLTHILRREWGFNGFVVSDCDAVYNVCNDHKYVPTLKEATALCLHSGNDLNCKDTYTTYGLAALNSGLITEADLDTAVCRILRARFLLGEFDPSTKVPYKSIPASELDGNEHRQLALRAAREAIVLLKNNQSFLPLNRDSIKRIAVIGPHANAVQLGEYSGAPAVSISPLQGIAAKLGVNVDNGYIEAESFTKSSGGPRLETCNEGGSQVGYITNGSYIVLIGLILSVMLTA
jgi:beta-glucosidase